MVGGDTSVAIRATSAANLPVSIDLSRPRQVDAAWRVIAVTGIGMTLLRRRGAEVIHDEDAEMGGKAGMSTEFFDQRTNLMYRVTYKVPGK